MDPNRFGFDYKADTSEPVAPVNTIRPNVRAALDYLDGIFCRGGQDAQDLWNIVTALRGPDDASFWGKEAVTIPIRRAALPRTTIAVNIHREPPYTEQWRLGVHQYANFSGSAEYGGPTNLIDVDAHFTRHGVHAAIALGLI